jgi:hypothetical protein
VTGRTKIDRPITPQEVAVIRCALQRAARIPEVSTLGEGLESLRAIDKCPCGCDSVTFIEFDAARPPKPIADAVGTTPEGGSVGVIVWGRADAVTGLEVYGLGAAEDDQRLPVLDSIRSWDESAA